MEYGGKIIYRDKLYSYRSNVNKPSPVFSI
jgi:hypothetical protein